MRFAAVRRCFPPPEAISLFWPILRGFGVAGTVYGTTSGGEEVRAFRLGGDRLSAVILDMGGTITEITIAGRDGRRRNVVLGVEDLAAYEASGWWNCLIGRYANRLKGGITLEGQHYPLIQDDNGVILHGGRGSSWGSRLWEVTEHNDKALFLKLVSADDDQGFPGTVTAEVTYTVSGDALQLDYAAVTDAPTVINLTNHVYFNLAGESSVLPQQLQLNADGITPTDTLQIPTGEIADVSGTPFDFREPHAIGERLDVADPQLALAGGYDHNFVLNKRAPGALEWAARLKDPESGIQLELLTTEPGLQVYSGNNIKSGRSNSRGQPMHRHDGLALETQHFPDSPNQPLFPSTLLLPGQEFRSTTLFRFSVA
jgi:aldose 1-epimerase